MQHALEISGLKKVYPNQTVALKNLDLTINSGDFFGFLGENGAGKSTMIGIITSLIKKTAGTVKVFGYNIDENPTEAKRCIGLVPQEINCNIFETVINILLYQAGYYGVTRQIALKCAEYYLKKLDLWNYRYRPCMSLSGGMKRRLMLARALLHLDQSEQAPALLILDEPTAGVDVELRRTIWSFLKELNEKGTTVMLTTHYLEEAEQLCKNLAVIDKGEIITKTTVQSLMERLSRQTFVCDLKNSATELPQETSFQMRLLSPHQLEIDIHSNQTFNQLFSHLSQTGIEVTSLRPKTNRLETVFLDLIRS